MHLCARRRRAARQAVPRLANRVGECRIHGVAGHALAAGFVVHLLQVGAIAEPPGLGQFLLADASGVFVVQEPGDFAPAAQRFHEFDAVRPAADGALQLGRIGLAADGLGVQERGDDRLLRGAAWRQRRKLVLDLLGLCQLAFQQPRPIRRPAFAAGIHDVGQVLHRFGNARFAGRCKQRGRADQWACVPLPRAAQGRGQRAQNASRALERRQLRPLAVEHVREVRVEGKTGEKPRFLGGTILGRGLVQLGEFAHHADDVRLVRIFLLQAFALEETAPQHLRDILPRHRLHALFALPPHHREQFVAHSEPDCILLLRIGGEQRSDHRGAIHLADRRHQMLKEIDDARLPLGVQPDLLAGIHQHLVNQHQSAEAPLARNGQQLRQERFRRRRFAFLGFAVRMDRA